VKIPKRESEVLHVGRTNNTIATQKRQNDKQSSTKHYTKNQRMGERKETLILLRVLLLELCLTRQ
jgi:hypothetical protein